jgi:glycosyltransferase involved in cell wall biosynthesis
VLTQSPPEMIAGPLRARGVREEDFLVRRVAPADIPRYLKAADLAVSFIKPCFSKLSSSPTKLAEYLAAGLPVICNAGVGDVDALVEGERVGVVVRELSRAAYRAALAEAEALRREPDAAARCRDAARRHFDLAGVGGLRYQRLYRRVIKN